MKKISQADLRLAWQVLTDMLENYDSHGRGWATICETRRLVEVELREQQEKT